MTKEKTQANWIETNAKENIVESIVDVIRTTIPHRVAHIKHVFIVMFSHYYYDYYHCYYYYYYYRTACDMWDGTLRGSHLSNATKAVFVLLSKSASMIANDDDPDTTENTQNE